MEIGEDSCCGETERVSTPYEGDMDETICMIYRRKRCVYGRLKR